MDRDTLIMKLLENELITVDIEKGLIYSKRVSGKKGENILLKGSISKGYVVHRLSYKGIKKQVRAHRVIWMAKHGLIPNNLVVDHINRQKTDNRIENLRVVTVAENNQNKEFKYGEKNKASKISDHEAQEIISLYKNSDMTIRELADDFKISKSQIHNIVVGKSRQLDKSRLIALGNAVVPQQIYPILATIKAVNDYSQPIKGR